MGRRYFGFTTLEPPMSPVTTGEINGQPFCIRKLANDWWGLTIRGQDAGREFWSREDACYYARAVIRSRVP